MHGECPNMQCSRMIAVLSIFWRENKIALTGVRSRVRESLIAVNLILLTLYFLLVSHFLVKSAFQQFIK